MIGSGRTEAEDYSVEEGQWISVMNCLFQNTLFCGSRWISKDANFMVENGSGVEWSNNTMQRMASFYDQIYAVKVDDLTLTQQKAVKELKEMAVKVVEWKYIDEQIATLTEKVYDGNKK